MAPAKRDFCDSRCGGLCLMNPVCGNQCEAASCIKIGQTTPSLGPVFLLLRYTIFHQNIQHLFSLFFPFSCLFFFLFPLSLSALPFTSLTQHCTIQKHPQFAPDIAHYSPQRQALITILLEALLNLFPAFVNFHSQLAN